MGGEGKRKGRGDMGGEGIWRVNNSENIATLVSEQSSSSMLLKMCDVCTSRKRLGYLCIPSHRKLPSSLPRSAEAVIVY